MTPFLKAKLGTLLDIVPWVSQDTMKNPRASSLWAMTMNERFEDFGAALRVSGYDVKKACDHASWIFFVRLPGRNPVLFFQDIADAPRVGLATTRVTVVNSSEVAAAKSDWSADSQFFRAQGPDAELNKLAALPGVHLERLSYKAAKGELAVADLFADVAAVEEALKLDLILFPHSALLASNGVEQSALVKIKFDKEDRTKSPSFGDQWQLARRLSRIGYAVTMRPNGIRILSPLRLTAANVAIIAKESIVEKVLPDKKVLQDLPAVGAAGMGEDAAAAAAQAPAAKSSAKTVVLRSGIPTPPQVWKQIAEQFGLVVKKRSSAEAVLEAKEVVTVDFCVAMQRACPTIEVDMPAV